jgi:hypothetical protein
MVHFHCYKLLGFHSDDFFQSVTFCVMTSYCTVGIYGRFGRKCYRFLTFEITSKGIWNIYLFLTIPINSFDENNIVALERAVFCHSLIASLWRKAISWPCKEPHFLVREKNIVALKRTVFSDILVASLCQEITLRPLSGPFAAHSSY